MGGRLLIYGVILLFLMSSVSALTPDEKVYFDQQNQKTIAQINSKIDTQTNRIESNLKNEVDKARKKVREEISQELRTGLKSVALGLFGIIIIALAGFKIIDIKLNTTRAIKKYEDDLKKQKAELDKLHKQAQGERVQLEKARQDLVAYQKMMTGSGKKQQIPELNVARPQMPGLKQKKPLKIKKWMIGIIMVMLFTGIMFSLLKYMAVI